MSPRLSFFPDCVGESVQKKHTTVTDECGNEIEVEQVLLIEDNDPLFGLKSRSSKSLRTTSMENHSMYLSPTMCVPTSKWT